jgi:hypothetical protein
MEKSGRSRWVGEEVGRISLTERGMLERIEIS